MGIPILKFREVDKERFEEIKNGVKAIETRAGTKEYQSIEAGGEIKFVCGNDVFSKKILRKYHWSTIEDMLTEVPIKKVMPTTTTPTSSPLLRRKSRICLNLTRFSLQLMRMIIWIA